MQNLPNGFARLSARNKVFAAIGALILVACVCGGMLNLFQTGNPAVSKDDLATQTAEVVAAMTATAAPTPKPTATPTLIQAYTAIVKRTTGSDAVQTDYDPSTKTLAIIDNIGEQINTSAAVLIFRGHAMQIFQDIYTGHEPHPDDVTIRFLGPTQNAYGQSDPNGYYASAELTADTASQIVWANLTQDQAWQVYDSTDEAPFFNS